MHVTGLWRLTGRVQMSRIMTIGMSVVALRDVSLLVCFARNGYRPPIVFARIPARPVRRAVSRQESEWK